MNVAFTNHARERMAERAITERMVMQVVRKPTRTQPEADGDTKFIGKAGGVTVHVVCKPLPAEDKWLVKSVWVRGQGDVERPAASRYRRPGRSLSPRWIGVAVAIVLIVLYILTR